MTARMPMAREVVFAYNFAPFVDASAITAVKRVAARGEMVDVVSQDLSGLRTRDDSLYSMVASTIDRHFLLKGRVAFDSWESVAAFVQGGLESIARTGRLYDRAYSRSMWPHSHFLGALAKIRHPSTYWVAEFSDPLRRDVSGGMRSSAGVPKDLISSALNAGVPSDFQGLLSDNPTILNWAEFLPYALADELVFTNEQQRDVMIAEVEDPGLRRQIRGRARVSYHPIPDEKFYQGSVSSGLTTARRLRLAYFGTFYTNRGLGQLLEALSAIRFTGGLAVELDVYGEAPPNLQSAATILGIGDLIRTFSPVPYLESLRLQSTYDGLVLNDAHAIGFEGLNPFLPSKLSDYLGSGSRILALLSPGSPASSFGLEYAAKLGDVSSIQQVLSRLSNDVMRARPN
ncbi:hypothetical protein [Oerskovia sp. Root22]|uniref:hypothetical protein n=1 Tax=Oerskovia sp. Root22 TaxID=1736494 RepID=UPI000B2E920C|nr:hypothetical protein [Oerskovia sp. Root22]